MCGFLCWTIELADPDLMCGIIEAAGLLTMCRIIEAADPHLMFGFIEAANAYTMCWIMEAAGSKPVCRTQLVLT